MLKYLPNIISFSRILISPVLLFTLSKNFKLLSIILLIVGSLSDFLDGHIARKLKVESKFGELIDPIADKIFSNTILWGIYAYNGHSFPILLMALTLTIRDSILICGGIFIIIKKLSFSMTPVYISKVCTCFIFLLSIIAVGFGTNNAYFEIISYFCLVTILITILIYLHRFFKRKK